PGGPRHRNPPARRGRLHRRRRRRTPRRGRGPARGGPRPPRRRDRDQNGHPPCGPRIRRPRQPRPLAPGRRTLARRLQPPQERRPHPLADQRGHRPTRWGPEQAFDWAELFPTAQQAEAYGGRRGVTYQNLHALDGVLHCFVRAINDDPCYLVSHDDGSSWEYGGRLLTREKIGYVNGYARYASGTRFGT